jgi:hypothetical protein
LDQLLKTGDYINYDPGEPRSASENQHDSAAYLHLLIPLSRLHQSSVLYALENAFRHVSGSERTPFYLNSDPFWEGFEKDINLIG